MMLALMFAVPPRMTKFPRDAPAPPWLDGRSGTIADVEHAGGVGARAEVERADDLARRTCRWWRRRAVRLATLKVPVSKSMRPPLVVPLPPVAAEPLADDDGAGLNVGAVTGGVHQACGAGGRAAGAGADGDVGGARAARLRRRWSAAGASRRSPTGGCRGRGRCRAAIVLALSTLVPLPRLSVFGLLPWTVGPLPVEPGVGLESPTRIVPAVIVLLAPRNAVAIARAADADDELIPARSRGRGRRAGAGGEVEVRQAAHVERGGARRSAGGAVADADEEAGVGRAAARR